jgi:NAD(P)-dependent dehydrogenase (short-subunit alcohol dehydrogenase family)
MVTNYPFPLNPDEFNGARVLVTGGTKGIGQAIVRRFLLSDASVALTARSPAAEDQAPALFVQADIGTASGAQEVVERIQRFSSGSTLDLEQSFVGVGVANVRPSPPMACNHGHPLLRPIRSAASNFVLF